MGEVGNFDDRITRFGKTIDHAYLGVGIDPTRKALEPVAGSDFDDGDFFGQLQHGGAFRVLR